MSGRRWLETITCFAVTLLVSAGASAERQFDAAGAVAPTSPGNLAWVSASETLQSISSSQWRFEAIGRQFTEPIDTLSGLRNPADTHSPVLLPAVPAAISMTLCGFLCVSFVRDRRAWFAIACGILWLGQAGIQAVPQLGHKLCCRVAAAKHSTAKLNPALAANSFERTGNGDTIRYIGLLRRLEGIPDRNLSSLSLARKNVTPVKTGARNSNLRLPLPATGNYDIGSRKTSVRKHSAPPRAFTAQTNWPERLIACPAGAAGHFIIFSPAFIFSNLSRGPPAIEMRVFATQTQRAGSRNVL